MSSNQGIAASSPMSTTSWLIGLGGFGLGLIFSSFVEYAVHRLMHWRVMLGKVHTRHHKHGAGDGAVWEWLYYIAGAGPAAAAIAFFGYLLGIETFAFGFAIGGIAYGTFSAYAHQLQHDRPELVFWMPMPVHYMHHRHQQWRENFGIGTDVWDRLFGTYRRMPFTPERSCGSIVNYLQIKWL